MIDMVAISIPFLPQYVSGNQDNTFIDDRTLLEQFGLTMSGQVDFEHGKPVLSRLRHNFESLPSSFASLAFKVVNGTDFRNYPYVKIVGNPAKLLQGHNVFGSDNLHLCIMSVVESFVFGIHQLNDVLDWQHATIDYIDVTYSAHVENQEQAKAVIDIMRQIKVGQTKPMPDDRYLTSMYWNRGSEWCIKKAYLKLVELDHQIKLLTRKYAATKLEHYRHQLLQITSPEVRYFADGAIRFEARIFAKWLNRNGVPVALGLITDPLLQQNDPELLPRLWRLAFNDVLSSFEGATMSAYNSDAVLSQLKNLYQRVTPKGNISYSKALRLHTVYRSILNDGYEKTKAASDRATWGRILNDLQAAGLSKAQLMNLNGDQSNVIPLIRMINVDFSKQVPAGYVEPLSLTQQYQKQPALLRLVS